MSDPASFVPGALASAGHVAAVSILLNAAPRLSPVAVHVAMAAAAGTALVTWAALAGNVDAFWRSASLLAAVTSGFFFVFSALYKSISIQMLMNAVERFDGRVAMADLARRCIARNFHDRITVATDAGLARRDGEAYEITGKGREAVRRVAAARRLFGVSTGALYGTHPREGRSG